MQMRMGVINKISIKDLVAVSLRVIGIDLQLRFRKSR